MTHKRATTRCIEGIDAESLERFIGGRRRHNRMRAFAAWQRRVELVRLLADVDLRNRGWQAEIARKLGVHRATVGRDLTAIGIETLRGGRAKAEADLTRGRSFLFQLERCLDPSLFREPS